jgi:hypothetical protein
MKKLPREIALQRAKDLFDCELFELTTVAELSKISKVAMQAFDEMLFDLHIIEKSLRVLVKVNTIADWCEVVEAYANARPKDFAELVREWRTERVEKWKRARSKPKQGFARYIEKIARFFWS